MNLGDDNLSDLFPQFSNPTLIISLVISSFRDHSEIIDGSLFNFSPGDIQIINDQILSVAESDDVFSAVKELATTEQQPIVAFSPLSLSKTALDNKRLGNSMTTKMRKIRNNLSP